MSNAKPDPDITDLLRRSHAGDRDAHDQLFRVVYDELKEKAREVMRGQRGSNTLQVTGLVHETYLRLQRDRDMPFEDRIHFLKTAACAMRQILIDHARARGRRGEGSLDGDHLLSIPGPGGWVDATDLAEALEQLEERSPKMAEAVSFKLFTTLTHAEIAKALKMTERTFERHWRVTKAWLYERLDQRLDE